MEAISSSHGQVLDLSRIRDQQETVEPLVVAAEKPEYTLSAYKSLYLKEKVRQEGLVGNIDEACCYFEIISNRLRDLMNLQHTRNVRQVYFQLSAGNELVNRDICPPQLLSI